MLFFKIKKTYWGLIIERLSYSVIYLFAFISMNSCAIVSPSDCFNFEVLDKANKSAMIISYSDSLERETVIIPRKIKIGTRHYKVESIGDFAFAQNNVIKHVFMPNTIRTIGHGAFFECSNLHDIVFSKKTHIIGASAFYECYSLKQIELPRNLKIIDECAFQLCSNLEEIVIPDKVTKIGNRAFEGSDGIILYRNTPFEKTKLKKIVIGHGIKELGDRVFAYNAIESIHIPNNIKIIGPRSFSTPYTLTEVWCYSNEPPSIESGQRLDWAPYYTMWSFEYYDYIDHSIIPKRTLHVPIGSKDTYQKTEGWNYFDNIVEDAVVQ